MPHLLQSSVLLGLLHPNVSSFRKTINISKSISWRNYVSSIISNSPLSAIWRRIHKISNKHPRSSAPVLHINNEHIANPLLRANELGTFFFSKISSGSHLPSQFTNIKLTAEQNPITFSLSTESYNTSFSSLELTSALKSCHNTYEGLEGIYNLMLKHLLPLSLAFLLEIFNRI